MKSVLVDAYMAAEIGSRLGHCVILVRVHYAMCLMGLILKGWALSNMIWQMVEGHADLGDNDEERMDGGWVYKIIGLNLKMHV